MLSFLLTAAQYTFVIMVMVIFTMIVLCGFIITAVAVGVFSIPYIVFLIVEKLTVYRRQRRASQWGKGR